MDQDKEIMDIPPLNDYRLVTGGSRGAQQAAETLVLDYGIPFAIKIGPKHPHQVLLPANYYSVITLS